MKGALIELLAKGKQDELLITTNPDISKFRNVYKRFVNYSRFETEQTITSGQANFGNTIVIDIDKKGDLLTHCMLEIKLPATGFGNVSWTNSIGIHIIKNIKLKLGGITIDEFTGEYIDAYYKHHMDNAKYTSYTEMIKNISGFINTSNIAENRLYIPLPFWFSNNIGTAFPLINLSYMDMKIEITFKSLNECLFNDTDTINYTGLEFTDCRFYTEMIYLQKDERVLFLKTKEFDYLIEQRQFHVFSITSGQKNKNISFNFNNPVKEIMWFYRDNYHKNRNSWEILTLNSGANELEPFEEVELLFNGQDRIKKRSAGFFRLVEPSRHHNNNIVDYYYFITFCDNSSNFEPSGYVNMSLIDSSLLNLTCNDNINNGEIYLYATNYNHLKIKNGMAGLLFN